MARLASRSPPGVNARPGPGPGEQRVVEFLAQLRDVHGHSRVGDAEFLGRCAHGAQPHHGRKGPKLRRCHGLSLRRALLAQVDRRVSKLSDHLTRY